MEVKLTQLKTLVINMATQVKSNAFISRKFLKQKYTPFFNSNVIQIIFVGSNF